MPYILEYGPSTQIHDRVYYCNMLCVPDNTIEYATFAYPDQLMPELDYNEWCPGCGAMLTHGMNVEDCTQTNSDCPDCPPLVVNLVAPYDDDQACEACGCTQYLAADKLN